MNTIAANFFDPIAKEYDQWFDENMHAFLSEVEAIKLFLPKQGKGIEIGVGTGRFAMELGIKYGIEPSENMAMYAKQRGVEVLIENAENMPYEDETFDFAIMVTVDCFMADVGKVYLEIFRILRRGGKLIVGTLHKDGAVAQKYMGMTESEVYKNARFHKVPETMQQLKISGFSGFNTYQTLFSMPPEEVEMPIPGHDRGSFVAIEAIKSN